jgi:hypothetical protein
MRVRPIVVVGGVFGAAALAALFVVLQLPREGQLSPPGAMPPAPPPSSPEDGPASAADGAAVLRVTAGAEPQANALVSLYRAVADEGTSWRRAGTGRTGADGIARIPARPGLYLAAVRAPGLAPGHVELVRIAGEDATRVEVELSPPAALDGTVRARPQGTPVAARVTILPAASAGLPPGLGAPAEEVVHVETDASGRFHAEGLAPGLLAARVDAAGFEGTRLERIAVPRGGPLEVQLDPLAVLEGRIVLAAGRPAAGAVVHALSAAHSEIATADAAGRFAMPVPAGEYALVASSGAEAGALPSLVAVAPGARQAGAELRLGAPALLEVVAERAGASAAGATIVLARHDSGGTLARAVARGDGRFDFADLAPGAYDLTVSGAGASPVRIGGITLAAGQRFTARAELPGTGAIEGTVADLSGKPLSGAHVRVISRGDGLSGVLPLDARSDFEGRYRVDGVEVGRAEVVATEAGATTGDARAVRVEAGRAARADLFVATTGFLSGRVTADGKKPTLGTAVVAVPLRAGLGTSQVARALADASGNYALAVPAGEYRVHAAPAEAPFADLRVQPAFVRVEPRLTTRLDLALAAAPAAEGLEVVVLEPGGAPSPGAIVTLARADDGKVALALTAGEDGAVRLAPGLGAQGGAITIRARNGGRAGALTGRLPASGSLVVRLAPGGALDGVLRTGARQVKGFTLEVTSQPTPEGWRTVDVHRFTGDRFALGDLPSEPLRLSVRTDDGRRGEAQVRLAAGESRDLEITLTGNPAGR